MAISGTATTGVMTKYDYTKVVREDLSDVIELVAQEDTPYTSNIGRDRCEQTYHEWNTDSLASANEDNAAVEGADVVLADRGLTNRVGNYTQIMTKPVAVSGTMQAINPVGGKKQLARELMKMGRELKLDREKRLVGVKAANVGNDTAGAGAATAREMASFGAWIKTNVSRGTGSPAGANPGMSNGSDGYPNAAPTDAQNTRAFTEALLKTVMSTAYTNGGKPKMLMLPPAQKVVASTFPGIAAQRVNISGRQHATIIGAADVYVSDFGDLAMVPNPQMRARDAWLVNPEEAMLVTLRSVQTEELAKTGDSEKRFIVWEGTHKITNEKHHGAIADLT